MMYQQPQVPRMPVAVNEDVASTLTDLEVPFPNLEQPWSREDRIKWERDMERIIKNQETRLWGKSVTSSRLTEFLKVPRAPLIWNGMTNIPKDIWATTLKQVKGFNRLLQLFDCCWPGKNRFFRSIYQFMQFALMLRGELHCLTILPTGSGKTLPVALYAKWLETNLDEIRSHIIILIPYVLLYAQTKQVMEEASISFFKWDAESRLGPNDDATVIAVSLEHSVRPEFWADMSPLLVERRIKGMVIDEAHAALDDRSFRNSFQSLGPRLATLPAPVWLLTATCPSKYEERLWSSLGIYETQKTTITLRQLQEDKDIFFDLVKVKTRKERCPFTEACASSILTKWLKNKTFDPTRSGKLLVLTHQRKDVEEVAKILGVDYIHGGVSWDRREQILFKFQNELNSHPALVANKACYYGIDIGCISTIIFIGLPDSLLSLQQAVGRAGRRGQQVHCQIMLPPTENGAQEFQPMSTQVDSAGQSLVPLLIQGTCVDGLLRAFFDGVSNPCQPNASHGIRCNMGGQFPYPFSPQDWQTVPPPVHITPPLPHWVVSCEPIPPSPLPSLAPALVKEREINLIRNNHIQLWGRSLLEIVRIFKQTSNSVKCLYCICKHKPTEKTTHTWFKCFPSDSKLKNYKVWDEKVLATGKVSSHSRVVYKAKGEWKHYYLPVFMMSSEEDSQLSSHMCKENLCLALSPVCGKYLGPVWEEEFHKSIQDSYGSHHHEDIIFEVIFVLWAEMSIRKEFLEYFKITDPIFMIHPNDPKQR
jgi:hypothetical protein